MQASPTKPIPAFERRLFTRAILPACGIILFAACSPKFGRPEDPDPAFDCPPAPRIALSDPEEAPGPEASRLQRRIERSIQRHARQDHFTKFAAAVVVGDRIVYRYLFNTTATRPFWVGSISKTFTALSVLRLVEAEMLRLEDDVATHLPGLMIPDPRLESGPVQIQDLLAHTSGLPDVRYYKARSYRKSHSVNFPEQIYPAGVHYRYSNHGFLILGRLVEHKTGLDYGTFLRRHVYIPLCMKNARVHRLINGASGVAVSLEDLAAYAAFWLRRGRAPSGRKILSEELMARMLRPRTVIPFGEKKRFAGLGWRVNRTDERVATFFHIGGAPYVAGWVQMFPEDNAAILYLGNPAEYNPSFEWFLTKTQHRLGELATLLSGAETPVHNFRADPPTRDLLEKYAGSYRNRLTGEKARVFVRRGSLYIKRSWDRHYKLYPFTAHVFKGGKDYTHYDFVYRKPDQEFPSAVATPDGYYKRIE